MDRSEELEKLKEGEPGGGSEDLTFAVETGGTGQV